MGTNFLSDSEFLGHIYPSPQSKGVDPNKAKFYTLGRCHSILKFKLEKPTDKQWKIAKNDKPGPGNYTETDKAFFQTL